MPTSGALKAMLKSDDGKNQKDWKMEEESLGNHYYYWHRMHETIHIKDDDITSSAPMHPIMPTQKVSDSRISLFGSLGHGQVMSPNKMFFKECLISLVFVVKTERVVIPYVSMHGRHSHRIDNVVKTVRWPVNNLT